MSYEQNTKFPEPFYYLIYQINAERDVKVKSLFTGIKSYLEDFPVLRFAGWDFKLGSSTRYAIDLKGIEHMDTSKRIRVTENGGLLAQGALNRNFLCWGDGQAWDESEKSKKIHSLALIEFTYSSLIALQRIIESVQAPITIESEIGFMGIDREYTLRYNRIGSGIISRENNFIDKGNSINLTLQADDLSEKNLPSTTYNLVVYIYRMFGLDGTQIPYSTETSGRMIIDVEQIRAIR